VAGRAVESPEFLDWPVSDIQGAKGEFFAMRSTRRLSVPVLLAGASLVLSTAGWDDVTGFGSPNANFINALSH
jgi:hypothetical protein